MNQLYYKKAVVVGRDDNQIRSKKAVCPKTKGIKKPLSKIDVLQVLKYVPVETEPKLPPRNVFV